MSIIGCDVRPVYPKLSRGYPADSTRLKSTFYLLLSAFFFAFLNPFPSVTYSGIDRIVIL